MTRDRVEFIFLNIGHFFDHLIMLVFATVAALALAEEWGLSYATLIPYATPGLIAFGVGALPAGWIADKWSRQGMMIVFFLGLGIAATGTGFARTPFEIGVALFFVGVFASIYHPVGLALVVDKQPRTGIALAVNGVYGNLGVACAALSTSLLLDVWGWRSAFFVPGIACIALGCAYWLLVRADLGQQRRASAGRPEPRSTVAEPARLRPNAVRIMAIVLVTTALGGVIFQSTTFALPKILSERLATLTLDASTIGWCAALIFTVAAGAQLLVGHLADRLSLRLVLATTAIMQIVFFGLMQDLTGILVPLVAAGFMSAVFGQIPINDVLVSRIAAKGWRSRAYALRFIVSFLAASTAVPLVAWVHGVWAFDVLFLILAMAAALVFLAALLLPPAREPVAFMRA